MKQVTKFVLLGIVFFTIIFGASQIFMDDAGAMFRCGRNSLCDYPQDPCNGLDPCVCQGDMLVIYCWPGEGDWD